MELSNSVERATPRSIFFILSNDEGGRTYFHVDNNGGDKGTHLYMRYSSYLKGWERTWKRFKQLATKHSILQCSDSDGKWPVIYQKNLLPAGNLMSEPERISTTMSNWKRFLEDDLPLIRRALKSVQRTK
jgi:hypothetical protein